MPVGSRNFEQSLTEAGIYLFRPAATLPTAAATVAQFNVVGMVELLGYVQEITTAVQAQANAVKLRHTPTGGTVGDISGTIDINGYVVGDYIVYQGPTGAGALSQVPLRAGLTTGAAGWTLRSGGIFLRTGALGFTAAATSTGANSTHLWYRPLFRNSTITVA